MQCFLKLCYFSSYIENLKAIREAMCGEKKSLHRLSSFALTTRSAHCMSCLPPSSNHLLPWYHHWMRFIIHAKIFLPRCTIVHRNRQDILKMKAADIFNLKKVFFLKMKNILHLTKLINIRCTVLSYVFCKYIK